MSRHVASRAIDGATAVPRRGGGLEDLGGHRGQRAVGARGGADPAALLVDDGGHPGDEVAEVVGEVAVVALDHPLVAEVAVGPERGVAQQVVAHAVDAEVLDEARRGDVGELGLAGLGLGQLLATQQQPAVDVDAVRRLDARRP